MLASYAWFSVGMALTAMTHSTGAFGWMRFATGLGIGSLVATTAALVAEYAPRDKKNLFIAISNGGIPLGSMMSAMLAIALMQHIGWRGMFWIGALPVLTLLPLAYFKMPESIAWLAARGRTAEAQALSQRTGVPLPLASASASTSTPATRATALDPTQIRSGFAGLLGRYYLGPTLVLGCMSATGLLLVYSLNTWLPELMLRAGYNTKGSLAFLAVLNGGSLFPPIGQLTYLLTLPPYGFYWFILAETNDEPHWHTPAPEPLPDYVTIVMRDRLLDDQRNEMVAVHAAVAILQVGVGNAEQLRPRQKDTVADQIQPSDQ